MQAPIEYAVKITALLKDTDMPTASSAIRIATVLLDHKASADASAALETAQGAFATSVPQSPLRTA